MKVETTVRDYRPMIDKRVRKYIEESDVFVHGIILCADDKIIKICKQKLIFLNYYFFHYNCI